MHIVRPYGYPSLFNTPRHSRHRISTRKWLPLHKLWQPLEVALLMPEYGADLVATFNRIPLGRKPFVIAFESHLPRLFGYERTAAFRHFTDRLAHDRCRMIVPISEFARRLFLRQHEHSAHREALEAKLTTIVYPSVEVPPVLGRVETGAERLRILFVGSHFARKGGVALLLVAQQAMRSKLPIELHIVSDLTVGGENGAWTDPDDPAFFDEYRELIQLPNVVIHGKLPNDRLLELMATCDVGALPTLCDTFGYSVLECFAAGLPVIATKAYALPELIVPGETGYMIDLDTDENGEWRHLFKMDRSTDAYRRFFKEAMHELAEKLMPVFTVLVDDPSLRAHMKKAAHTAALQRFEARRTSGILDELYEAAVAR